jgi:hypothetical protein
VVGAEAPVAVMLTILLLPAAATEQMAWLLLSISNKIFSTK